MSRPDSPGKSLSRHRSFSSPKGLCFTVRGVKMHATHKRRAVVSRFSHKRETGVARLMNGDGYVMAYRQTTRPPRGSRVGS